MTVREPDADELDREEADLDRADHARLIDDWVHERATAPDERCTVHGRYTPQTLIDGDCPHCRHDDHDQPGQTGHWDWPALTDK